MNAGHAGQLRVALLNHAPRGEDGALLLARALEAAGHEPELLTATPAPARIAERLLRRRQFDGPIAHLPFSLRRLLAGDYHVAHAFSPADAMAALAWRRLSGRPVVLGCPVAPGRDRLADRRLRLLFVSRAFEGSDAVVVPDDSVREAVERWLAVPAEVIALDDPAEHELLYRSLITIRA